MPVCRTVSETCLLASGSAVSEADLIKRLLAANDPRAFPLADHSRPLPVSVSFVLLHMKSLVSTFLVAANTFLIEERKLEMLGSIVSCLASPRKILSEKKFWVIFFFEH